MKKVEKNVWIVVEETKVGWTKYIVITKNGSIYTCGSMETAEKLAKSLRNIY